MTEREKVIIVGAGMAGLTAAAYLARENYEVLLLEKNNRVGGLVSTFAQDGFSFDTGPRAFVNSGMVKPMLKDLGIEWDYLGNKISIGIEDHLVNVESMDSIADYQQLLRNLYPESQEDIDKIIAVMGELSEITRILYEFDNPNFVDVMSDKKFIFRELIPWTFKFLGALRKMRKNEMPMETFLEGLTENRSLIDILTQHFFRKTPTHFALGYFYVYLDYFYPKGGTGALPNLLREKIVNQGGIIQLDTQVVEVKPAEKIILDTEGKSYTYDHLIWAADLKTLYQRVNPLGLEGSATQEIKSRELQMRSSKGAESVFILFVAVNRPPSFFASRGGPHLFYTPSRSGLGSIHRSDREDLIANFDSKSKAEIAAWREDFCRYNTYEVSLPALRDPALAPEGQTGVMISCLTDYQLFKKIQTAGWYDEFKESLENQIIDLFSGSIYPGIKDDILFKYSSTPLTINKISGSTDGAITGWSFETEMPVIDQLKDIPKSVFTPFPGILQAGQWAYAPSGVPIAMLTGWYATQKIIKGK